MKRKSLQDIANDIVRRDDEQLSTSIDPMRRRKGPYIFICVVSLLLALAFVIYFNLDLIKRKLEFRRPVKDVPKTERLRKEDEIRIRGDGIGSRGAPTRTRTFKRPKILLINPPLPSIPYEEVDPSALYLPLAGRYGLAFREDIDANLVRHSEQLVRFRTHMTDARSSFTKVRTRKGMYIIPKDYLRVLGAHGDFPNLFFKKDNHTLMNKLSKIYRGDRVHVYGIILLTEVGFVVLVHDFITE